MEVKSGAKSGKAASQLRRFKGHVQKGDIGLFRYSGLPFDGAVFDGANFDTKSYGPNNTFDIKSKLSVEDLLNLKSKMHNLFGSKCKLDTYRMNH